MGFTGFTDEDPRRRPELVARILICADEEVGVASTDRAAILPFKTKADHGIGVISVACLAVLTWYYATQQGQQS